MTTEQFEVLKLVLQEQRHEIDYRRTREFQVFSWSASLLLAIISAIFFRAFMIGHSPRAFDDAVRVIMTSLVIVIAFFSVQWQMYHHINAADRKKTITSLWRQLDCFSPDAFGQHNSLLPEESAHWGERHRTYRSVLLNPSRASAIVILSGVAIGAIWF